MWKTQAGKGAHARIWLWVYTKHRCWNAQGNFRWLLSLIFLPTDPNLSYFLSSEPTIPGFLFVFLSTHNTLQSESSHYPLFPPLTLSSGTYLSDCWSRSVSEARFLSFSVPLKLPFLRPLLRNSDDSAGTGSACWFIQMHLASAEWCQTRSDKWTCS